MKEETLDIFDEEMNHIGEAARSEVHQKGLWHQTFHCWILTCENDLSYLLFQRRHPEKDTFADKLDITSAGHLLAGEQVADGVRELAEELGLSVRFDDLYPVGVIPDKVRDGELIDNEFSHVFLYRCDQPLRQYILQTEEVTGLVKLEVSEALKLMRGQRDEVRVSGIGMGADGEYQDVEYTAGFNQFVPHEASYYETVFQAIERMEKVESSSREESSR